MQTRLKPTTKLVALIASVSYVAVGALGIGQMFEDIRGVIAIGFPVVYGMLLFPALLESRSRLNQLVGSLGALLTLLTIYASVLMFHDATHECGVLVHLSCPTTQSDRLHGAALLLVLLGGQAVGFRVQRHTAK